MAITLDFKAAAYHINRVLNGLQHQWCDDGHSDIRDFNSSVEALRDSGLPGYVHDIDSSTGRALDYAYAALESGKPTATSLFTEALTRVVAAVPEIAEHAVDFTAYCGVLAANKGRVYSRQPLHDPNIRP